VAIILTIFLKINCQIFSRLVWRGHTKFKTGMEAAIPLPAPLHTTDQSRHRMVKSSHVSPVSQT